MEAEIARLKAQQWYGDNSSYNRLYYLLQEDIFMRILFYDTKNYDRVSFEQQLSNFPEIEIEYVKGDLAPKSAVMAKGYDAVCAFVIAEKPDGEIIDAE